MRTVLFIMFAAAVCAALVACSSDLASPFDKPDESTQPITQGETSK